MDDKEAIYILLNCEENIINSVHSSIHEIVRLGLKEARKRDTIKNMIDSIIYILEDIPVRLNYRKENAE